MVNQAEASSPVVSLQDPGTGTASNKDPISAAMVGGALPHVSDVVINGLSLSADSSNGTISVTAGSALLEHPGGVSVQSSAGGSYDTTWNGSSTLPVSVGQTSGITEDVSGVNHVYLDVDTSTNNSVSIVVSGSENPSELGAASLYLGTADTSAGTADDSAGDRRLSQWEVQSLIAASAEMQSVDSRIYSADERFYVINTQSDWEDMKSERSSLNNPPKATVIFCPPQSGSMSITSIDFEGTLIAPRSSYPVTNDVTINADNLTVIGFHVAATNVPNGFDVQGQNVTIIRSNVSYVDVNAQGCTIFGTPGQVNVAADGCRIIGGDIANTDYAVGVDVASGVNNGLITGVHDVNLTGDGASNFTVGVVDKANSANSDLAYKSDL